MRKNKYFSLSLMLEGIKQTKTLGICLTIISIIVACFNPFKQILNGSEAQFHAFTVDEFVLPIFSMFYFIPTILIFCLFGFMNKRNSSDFYHSVPLNRSCVYITYVAVTMIWCIFIMLVSTFSSYILCSLAPNVIITPYFIWIALYSSFIAAFLAMSVALVAMGLSGNLFSDIVTFLLLMFAPRLIILVFTSAISSAVPIMSFDSIPLLRPYINILFIPFERGIAYSELMTDWGIMLYSIILALVYFVGGFFIHRARKSESAESAVAFKGVRHIVRSLIGIVPTLLICYPLALIIGKNSESSLGQTALVPLFLLGGGISVIAYFVYELITTKSAKKLLIAIPFYLIVVAFDFAFIFGSQAIGNSIINTVPVQSDIQSVSVKFDEYYNNNYSIKTYQECKAKAIDYENKELIKLLSDSLYSNVKALKERGNLYSSSYSYYATYKVVFHCKSGQNITRKVYVPSNANPNDSGLSTDEKIYNLMFNDKNFTDMGTVIPENDEVKKVYITDYSGTIYSSQFTNEEIQKIWQTFRDEYVSLSKEDKQMSCGYDIFENMDNISMFRIYLKGYTGVDAFYCEYMIGQKFTPKTYKIITETLDKYQKPLSSNEADVILSGINKDSSFNIDIRKINTSTEGNGIYYDIDEVSDLSAKDFENAAKAVKILTDAAQKGCDMSKDNVYMVSFDVDTERMPMQKFETTDYGSYSMTQIDCFVNLTDEEYKEFCGIADDFYKKQENSENSMIEESAMYD